MNTRQFLEFVREKYSGENVRDYRNLAIVELRVSNLDLFIPHLRWSHVHFTKKPFIQMGKASLAYPLRDSCRDALLKLLYGLWVLHSQTKVHLADEIFCRNLQPIEGRQLNEAEKELLELDLNLTEVSDIYWAIYQEARLHYSPNRPNSQKEKQTKKQIKKNVEIHNSIKRSFAIIPPQPEPPTPRRAEAPGVLTHDEILAQNQQLEDARVEAEKQRKRKDIDLVNGYSIFQQDPFYYPRIRARENSARIRELIENGGTIHAISVA